MLDLSRFDDASKMLIDKFGVNTQLTMVCEEVSEMMVEYMLIVANENNTHITKDISALTEEIADSLITLHTLTMILNNLVLKKYPRVVYVPDFKSKNVPIDVMQVTAYLLIKRISKLIRKGVYDEDCAMDLLPHVYNMTYIIDSIMIERSIDVDTVISEIQRKIDRIK